MRSKWLRVKHRHVCWTILIFEIGRKEMGRGRHRGHTERKERNYWWVKTLAQLLSTARFESYYMNFQKLTPSPAPYPIPLPSSFLLLSLSKLFLFSCWHTADPSWLMFRGTNSSDKYPDPVSHSLSWIIGPSMNDWRLWRRRFSALAASSWVTCSLLKSTPLKHMDFRWVQLRWWRKKGPLPTPCWEITEKKRRRQRTDRRKLRDKLSPKSKKKIWRRGQSRVSSTSGKWVQVKGVLPSLLWKVRYFSKSSLSEGRSQNITRTRKSPKNCR